MSVGGGGGGTPMAAGTGGGSRVPQPGYERMTDYGMGFGRIAQQPSFFNPFAGYYGYGQQFGGFGGYDPYGGFGGFGGSGGFGGYGNYGGYDGGYGGGYQSGIGGLFGGYNPFERGNAYVQPLPQRMPDYTRRPPRDPDFSHALPMPNPNPPGLQGGGLNDPMEVVYDALGQPGYRARQLTPEEIEAGRAAVRSGSPIAF